MKTQDLVCYLDFETQCDRDIGDGLFQYFDSPKFRFICAGWAIGDEEPSVWVPGEPIPSRLVAHVESGGTVAAHNAAFEQGACNTVFAADHGWPELKNEQLLCTMALCLQHNLPAGLDDAAEALKLQNRKYEKGARIMKKYMRPRSTKGGKIVWWDDPDELEEIYTYCAGDVRQEREIRHALFPMPEIERQYWILDQEINQRGVAVDPTELENAADLLEMTQSQADEEMRQVTGGAVGSVNCNAALAKFCGLASVDKGEVEVALAVTRDPARRRALEIRQESGLASTKKLKAMQRWRSEDYRIRGMSQYHGAGVTGRKAGRGPQPYNMTRPVKFKQPDIEQFFGVLAANYWTYEEIELFFGHPMRALADSIRGFFAAPKERKFVQVDFSSIEGITLAWLAGEEWVLEVYRTHGKMYEATAAAVLGKPLDAITKDDRQTGKVFELAFGYQGGVAALESACDTYKVARFDYERSTAIRDAWRRSRPATVQLWADIEQCAMAAVAHPGHQATLRRPYADVVYQVVEAPGGTPFLFCRLPSGRNIAYPHPAIELVETPWGQAKPGVTYLRRHPQRKHLFIRDKLYGGSLVENWVQATSRDLQSCQMLRFDGAGWPIVSDCYDEVLTEVPDTDEWTVEKAQEIARVLPRWARGMPVNAGGWEGKRYRK